MYFESSHVGLGSPPTYFAVMHIVMSCLPFGNLTGKIPKYLGFRTVRPDSLQLRIDVQFQVLRTFDTYSLMDMNFRFGTFANALSELIKVMSEARAVAA